MAVEHLPETLVELDGGEIAGRKEFEGLAWTEVLVERNVYVHIQIGVLAQVDLEEQTIDGIERQNL